jgi:peptidoglycan/xylan/chitin deacetylase (PgdA/CDA1 family)
VDGEFTHAAQAGVEVKISRAIAALVLVLPLPARAQTPDLQVAVTFDDVPGVAWANCTHNNIGTLNRKLLLAIERNRMPAAALVVTGPARCGSGRLAEIVGDWVNAGHEIGSHTHTHRDPNVIPTAAYLHDVDSAHDRLTAILRKHNQQLRYFRHPFLRAGDTPEEKNAIDAHLRSKGYEIAVVTVDNQEWVFAEAYARAKRARDTALVARIKPAYLAHIDSSFAYYEHLSQQLFGRQIPQILLLHANELNADFLDDVARVIRARGYRFVPMSVALRDRAYRTPANYVGRAGMSWLQRWAIDRKVRFRPEPREPAWLTP